MKPVTLAFLGGGSRGNLFAEWIVKHPSEATIVAIAEPLPSRRRKIAEMFSIPESRQFSRWEELLAQPQMADAVVNVLPDRLHVAPAIAAMQRGYHLLLEKPMAVTLADCEKIEAVRQQTGRIAAVCHGMRHHAVYAEAKRMLDAGVIGRLITFDQIEGVEPLHQAHSYVRGNWGNEGRSSFMLLAKSCHDIDVLTYLTGRQCLKVSSFGSLTYFKQDHAPAGAPLRCTDGCPVEHSCPYAATKLYLTTSKFWGRDVMFSQTDADVLEELKTSPYGRCVFRADNDVVDHQVVAFEYEDQITGTFTMTAFAHPGTRRLRLNGTHGEILADSGERTIEVIRFADRTRTKITIPAEDGGHGGADSRLMRNFIAALRANDRSILLTDTAESLRTHRITFAAEMARREGRVVEIAELMEASTVAS
jgi:predicted dehydrogenase